MTEFEVNFYCLYGYCKGTVYYVDANKERFLVADKDGDFLWVDIGDCRLVKDKLNSR